MKRFQLKKDIKTKVFEVEETLKLLGKLYIEHKYVNEKNKQNDF